MIRETKRRLRWLRNRLYSATGPGSLRHENRTSQEWEWAIGIYTGPTPLSLDVHGKSGKPVLTKKSVTDVSATDVADPFMLQVDGKWFMYFEVMVESPKRGSIGMATSNDGLSWEYRRIVLSEPFHLSYPYVFEWKGDYFLIPESSKARSVRLYKAEKFPDQWAFQCTLMEGGAFADSSVVYYNGKWWLFVGTNPQQQNDTLRLFYADELTGPWREHPMSPIISGNNRTARPAGRIQVVDGHLIRFAQDCYPIYGTAVRAFAVSELSPHAYKEEECQESPILGPRETEWNRTGMHHVDIHRYQDGNWIASVDGRKRIRHRD